MPPGLTLYRLDYLFAFRAVCSWMNDTDSGCTKPRMSRFSFRWDEPQTCGLISGNTCKIIFLMAACLVTAGAKREIFPISQHGLCAVTIWCWALGKNGSKNSLSFLFFFHGETCSLKPEALLLTELNQPCWCECARWLLKPEISHFFPCSWQTLVQHHACKIAFLRNIKFPQHSQDSWAEYFQITALWHGQSGYCLQ